MEIFEKNLNLLAKNCPQLAQRIKNHTEIIGAFSLEDAPSGDPNLMKNGYLLHDKFDPEQEAINLLKEVNSRSFFNTFHYIYGLGLGYVLKRFSKTLKGYILLYEPDLDVLRLTLEMVDFTDEFSNERVFVFDNIEDIENFYPEHFFHGSPVTTTIAQTYKMNDLENAQNFVNRLGYIHGIYASNYRTYWKKHHRWVNSLIENLDCITCYDEVKALKDKFKGKPAVVISAGPSLNKNIDLIAKYQENFVIFCVGTALKSALKHGIKPDFICFVEYHDVTAKMIGENEGENSNIILQPITCKEVYKRHAKNKFIFYPDNDEASKWTSKKFGIDTTDYINRGTVSVNALVSAKIMGCNPIILTGQDLAYTASKCYAEGSIYEDIKLTDEKVSVDNMENILAKTSVSKEVLENRFENLTKQLYKVKGQNGETLFSPGDYASFIKYFTEIADIYSKDTKLINATEGGAQIDGYENIKFAKVVEQFASKPLEKTLQVHNFSGDKNKKIIENEIKNAIELFNKSYKGTFIEGYNIAKDLQPEDFKYRNICNSKVFIPKLLKVYKNLRLLPKCDLLELLMVRNTFFIDYYIKKDLNDNLTLTYILKHLYYLFVKDFKMFIEPQIEALTAIKSD